MKKSTQAWVDFALRDISIANEVIENEYYSNIIAFHSHQAVEKIFKAVLVENNIKKPKKHSLVLIYGAFPHNIKSMLHIDIDELNLLDDIYIDSRYPAGTGILPNGLPTQKEAKQIYEIAKNIFDKIYNILK